MNFKRLSVFLLLIILGSLVPVSANAKAGMKIKHNGFTNSSMADSIPKKQPVKKDDQKVDDKKPDVNKVNGPVIKEVPKATRKLKPAAVKTKIKIPVKRVKPVIRKPVRLIKRVSGINI